MTRGQRFKYEMFVRVRDYGTAHRELFPESSTGGQRFAQVTAAVAAIDDHLENRIVGRAEARRVKRTTRAAVFDYMKTLALAGRRVTRQESGPGLFRLPRRRSLKVDLSTAGVFIKEAEKRQEQFIQLGLPPTFLSDFQALVDGLQRAVDVRLSSKTVRGLAQAGIADTLSVVGHVEVRNSGPWTAGRATGAGAELDRRGRGRQRVLGAGVRAPAVLIGSGLRAGSREAVVG
jgi:hypothetical protein